jgi:haloacetate dehalogenase
MWGKTGAMARHFDVPATWNKNFSNIQKKPMEGGHFFPDQYPQETVSALASFIISNID